MLVVCTECGNKISHTAEHCPRCGQPGAGFIAYTKTEEYKKGYAHIQKEAARAAMREKERQRLKREEEERQRRKKMIIDIILLPFWLALDVILLAILLGILFVVASVIYAIGWG